MQLLNTPRTQPDRSEDIQSLDRLLGRCGTVRGSGTLADGCLASSVPNQRGEALASLFLFVWMLYLFVWMLYIGGSCEIAQSVACNCSTR